jgi:uncharacterized membrane protein YgaE (UPF0421/DUF939 family)
MVTAIIISSLLHFQSHHGAIAVGLVVLLTILLYCDDHKNFAIAAATI